MALVNFVSVITNSIFEVKLNIYETHKAPLPCFQQGDKLQLSCYDNDELERHGSEYGECEAADSAMGIGHPFFHSEIASSGTYSSASSY